MSMSTDWKNRLYNLKILNLKISNTLLLLIIVASLTECKKDELKIIDIDGNSYHIVTIGTQVWMTENLKTTKYNDGTPIPLVTDGTAWSNLSSPGYCWNGADYGALYNWYTVNTAKVCPQGWHVPTDVEWHTLILYLDAAASLSGYPESLIAGGKLKETGTKHWQDPNTGATNETGFTALPGGYRSSGGFSVTGLTGIWWSSSESYVGYAWNRYLLDQFSGIGRYADPKGNGNSVRCLKDK